MNKISILFEKIIVCSLLLCLGACEYKRSDNKSFKVTKDGDGNLQSEINYINDTIMQGVAKYYYYPKPANVLKDEIDYNMGIKDGWQKHYRENGTLESNVHYKNGLADGLDYRYYEDGTKIKSENHWLKGKQYGVGKWYYKNGQLETFNVSDFYNNVLYVIQYDEQGNKTKEDGVVFSPKFTAFYTSASDSTQTPIRDNTVKANKEITTQITVAQPPQTKTTIRMGELNKRNMVELPIEVYTATYTQTYPKSGKYTLVTIGEIKDLKGNILKRDSITTAIVVED